MNNLTDEFLRIIIGLARETDKIDNIIEKGRIMNSLDKVLMHYVKKLREIEVRDGRVDSDSKVVKELEDGFLKIIRAIENDMNHLLVTDLKVNTASGR